MSRFQSIFAERLASYVELRQHLGFRFEGQQAILHAFDRYVHEREYHGPLTERLAHDFALSVADPSTTVPARRYLVVRHFAEYLATYDSSTPRLDPKAILRRRQQPPPFIFTDQELEALMDRATQFIRRHPVSNVALRTMIGLAASTGMRPGEVVRLDQAHVDLQTGILIVRRTKLNKDRLVPTHSTTLDALRVYAAHREQMPEAHRETAFFLNSRTHRYQIANLDYLFRRLARSLDLRARRGTTPTFRSLRHTFAVRRLIAWYRGGEDVQARLPALATYMGHVHYTSTAYYLTATAEMLSVAANRLYTTELGHGQQT